MNLLEETLHEMARAKLTHEKIVFIGSEDSEYACTWEEFVKLANVEYDAGFGAQEVAEDLVIEFTDGTSMRRVECDGSEHWSVTTPPKPRPPAAKSIKRLIVCDDLVGWCTLSEIHDRL